MTTKLVILGILLALLIVNSYLTYRFLEIPAQRYLRNKFRKKEVKEAPLVAPVKDKE